MAEDKNLLINGLEEDILEAFDVEELPQELTYKLHNRLYEHERQLKRAARLAVVNAMDSLLAKILA